MFILAFYVVVVFLSYCVSLKIGVVEYLLNSHMDL